MPPRPRIAAAPKAKEMPAHVKKHFEARPGYVNYHFNKLAQERIWNGLVARGSFEGAKGSWTIEGTVDGGGGARFRLDESRVTMTLASGESAIAVGEDLTQALDPPQSGGLLSALHLWRRLLVQGLDKYGQVYYLGTLPIAGREGLADALVGTHAGVECRFLTDRETGHLLAVEMFPDDESDPCELYFSDYGEFDGRLLPRKLVVRHADDVYGAFELTHFKFENSPEKKP